MVVDKRRVLFIGGIPSSMTEEVIRDHFSQYDTIVNVRIMKDRKTKGSKGYAFVTVSDHLKIPTILATPQVIAGRTVDVQVASRRGEKEKWKEEQRKRKLFISNIPSHIDNESLQNFFSKFGEVRNAFVIRDFATKASLNYGYVEFVDANILDRVFSTKELELDGADLICMPYQGKPQDKKMLEPKSKGKHTDSEESGVFDAYNQGGLPLAARSHQPYRMSKLVSNSTQVLQSDGRRHSASANPKYLYIELSSRLNEAESNYGFNLKGETTVRVSNSYSRAFVSAYSTFGDPHSANAHFHVGLHHNHQQSFSHCPAPASLLQSGLPSSIAFDADAGLRSPDSRRLISSAPFNLFN